MRAAASWDAASAPTGSASMPLHHPASPLRFLQPAAPPAAPPPQELRGLFERNKGKYGCAGKELEVF